MKRPATRRHKTTAPPSAASPRATKPSAATPLARRLDSKPRATPQDLYALALQWWITGERFDIGRMAQQLHLSRATVFRWVGSRELLYGEILSSMFERAFLDAKESAQGEGAALVADVTRKLMERLLADESLRRFVQQDPEFAMRVLMSRSSTVEQRSAAIVRAGLVEGIERGLIQPELDLDALAYLIVRIGESFLYRDVIAGVAPDIEPAITAIELLLTGKRR